MSNWVSVPIERVPVEEAAYADRAINLDHVAELYLNAYGNRCGIVYANGDEEYIEGPTAEPFYRACMERIL